MKAVLRFLANVIVLAILWLTLWWLLDFVPGFEEPLLSTWSIAKFSGFIAAMLIVSLNRHKFPWLRLGNTH
ncbi:hypothetical protein [Qipengyuania gaetbuli]|uniref:hypothetical protein n=1 Tax=Qipengyuania gaetbuli TaxID=266952 RepID=UPI001CD1FEF4|nr:hypothetical protein [Qipengyuania gaetbuli]MCA0908905.1 hypothetical protein [Qipengyuania gaetbuli]